MSNQTIHMPNGSFDVTIIDKGNYKEFKDYKKIFFVQKGLSRNIGEAPIVCLKKDKNELIVAFSNPENAINFFDFFKNNDAKTRFSLHGLPMIEISIEDFFKTSSPYQSILLDPPKEMKIPYF